MRNRPHRRRTRPPATLIDGTRPSGVKLRALLEANATLLDDETLAELSARPKTRGDCVNGERPCPWLSCKHTLLLDITPSGSIKINHPDGLNTDSCSLDVADRGATTLEIVGGLMNLSRQAVNQVEGIALRKLKRKGAILDGGDV